MHFWILIAKFSSSPWSNCWASMGNTGIRFVGNTVNDKVGSHIVVAATEEEARKIASQHALNEKPYAWLSTSHSSCERLDGLVSGHIMSAGVAFTDKFVSPS